MSDQDQPDTCSRRAVLRKIAGGVSCVALGGVSACASRPEGSRTVPGQVYRGERRGFEIIELQQRRVIVEDWRTGQRYAVTILSIPHRNSPQMDCMRDERSRRPSLLPGLLNPLLDAAHNATQSFKLAGCEGYINVTEPMVRTFQDSISRGIAALNGLEIHPSVYGSTDEGGRVIRAAEDPNRIIVVEPYPLHRRTFSGPRRTW